MSQPTHEVIIHRHALADLEQDYRIAWENGGDHASAGNADLVNLLCPRGSDFNRQDQNGIKARNHALNVGELNEAQATHA